MGDPAAAAGPDPGGPAQLGPRPRHGEAAQGARPGGADPFLRQAAGAGQPRSRRHLRLSEPVRAGGRPFRRVFSHACATAEPSPCSA
ncbi:hypothetical protein SCOCK_200141 [Actinacidiphila cocklensis]|uniref:Uncharacterized protein n=1 Tax=Actinacidiphila cocklensis TaxID=887465 RepID=A0A9W4GQF6_9ACTN|nr:hypothetical protein SCOCK_200141 [Actinacidiphila cocklensis]